MTIHTKDSFAFNDANAHTTRPSLYAGMPSGIQLISDWRVVDYFNRLDEDSIPGATEEPGASWTVTVTGTTPAASISDDLVPGRLIITNSGGDNDSWEGQETATSGPGEQWALRSGKKLYFKTSFLLTDTNDDADTVEQCDLFLGLAITDTTLIDGATDFIGFHKADASGEVNFVAGKNAGASGALVDDITQSTGVTLAAGDAGVAESNLHTFEFLADGTEVVYVYADGSYVATVTSTTELPDDENLCASIAFQNGEGTAKIMHLAQFLVAMER